MNFITHKFGYFEFIKELFGRRRKVTAEEEMRGIWRHFEAVASGVTFMFVQEVLKGLQLWTDK